MNHPLQLVGLNKKEARTLCRQQILEAVCGNQVVLISGETGCGKTTQVPQYLLDEAWQQGQACRVLCTQPRRISAVSVADRVATERGETSGDTVGYTIRLESKYAVHNVCHSVHEMPACHESYT